MTEHETDRRQDGTMPPPATLAQITTPGALRTRAWVRDEIAKQDMVARDSWAYARNVTVAATYRARAGEA
jgi:hypothetical protein